MSPRGTYAGRLLATHWAAMGDLLEQGSTVAHMCSALMALLVIASGAGAEELEQPPAPPMENVTESLYGHGVTDPYRKFEALDAHVLDWIKGQAAYTRRLFDSIQPHAGLVARLASLEGESTSIDGYQRFGGREFFLERGASNYDLMVQDGRGVRKLIDTASLSESEHGTPSAISYFLASPDGTRVAAGISRNGSEDASIFVYDVESGRVVAGPVDRAQFGFLSWSDDGRVLYFNRLRKPAPEASETDKYKFSSVQAWDLQSPPLDLIGGTSGVDLGLDPAESAQVVISRSAPMAALVGNNGAQPEIAIWVAPKREVGSQVVHWKQIVTHRDGITAFAMSGDTLFLLSNRNAPTFKVLTLKVGEPLSSASTLLPARRDRVIASIHAAADGLYVQERVGLYSRLRRIARSSNSVREIPLPGRGAVSDAFTDPSSEGITFSFESWAAPPREYYFDPAVGSIRDLGLAAAGPAPRSLEVHDLEAKAKDGTAIPLTVMSPKYQGRPLVALMEVYGSYGISLLPYFSASRTSFVTDGNVYAVCHVRGGGELGEAWRLGGKDANKPNTWRDLIACGEDLIARGIARKDGLFVFGGSAGGIAVGMAMVERPDLFAGVIDAVPPANMVRFELTPDGPLETQEFGSVKTEQGFRNLLAIDTYQNVREGVRYPPVLITMGMNDPRIAAWQPAKLAAKLMAYGNPTLLRVDLDGGHGVGATKQQHDLLFADIFSFVYWQSGRRGWMPWLGPAF